MSRGVGLDEAVAALPSRANMCLLPRIVLKGSDSASVWHSPLFFSHLSSSLPVVAFSDVVVIHVGSDAASRTHSVGASLRIITAQSRRWSHNGNTGANGVSLSHQGFFPDITPHAHRCPWACLLLTWQLLRTCSSRESRLFRQSTRPFIVFYMSAAAIVCMNSCKFTVFAP